MTKQPTLFISHGAGPCFWMTMPKPIGPHGFDKLRDYYFGLLDTLNERPKAILVISGHWEESVPTVSTSPAPGMLFDYYGFPEHTYQLSYRAPGAPEIARRIGQLLDEAGIAHTENVDRAFDHGVFVPMLFVDPQAQIPVVMLSMRNDLSAGEHIVIGQALEPLREEGVLIIGSGSSYHDLRGFFSSDTEHSTRFDTWLTQTVEAKPAERNARLAEWTQAPSARLCHPREEHLIPLMVAAGAAGADIGARVFSDRIGTKVISCFAFGDDAGSS
ncbi:DODA-type extradiol aromatic ring-opening family dioxygenase [Luteibacter sp. 9135]|uniref:DODA-type extradiol aromatic ring-opening family dioxygenase n=1 Tax=Luteibacter sp. 9135 TaxID=1500893 RepID=UPI00056643F1|nr:class III extradiol ring-cleavage dioxygenase [Luteibacter sp. 9135]